MLQASLVGADDATWSDALAHLPHDFHHLPGYTAFASRHHDRGEAVAFLARDGDRRFLLPLILRELPAALRAPAGERDAVSGRGYPGPVSSGGGEDRFVEAAVDAMVEVLRDARVITAFVRLHPFHGVPAHLLERVGQVVEHGSYVTMDLAPPDDAYRAGLRRDHRHAIVKAARDGYTARIDDRWEHLDEYLDAYAQSMERVGSTDFWRLGRPYFDELRAAMGDRAHLMVVERDGTLAAACMLLEEAGSVDYHLAATTDAHRRASPSKLLIDAARSWARARGDRWLHLGGSLRPDDPLIQFKLGFSPLQHPVSSWRITLDARTSAALEDRARAVAPLETGLFPGYRDGAAGTREPLAEQAR